VRIPVTCQESFTFGSFVLIVNRLFAISFQTIAWAKERPITCRVHGEALARPTSTL